MRSLCHRVFVAVLGLLMSTFAAADTAIPKYKPSSRSPQALDIRTNAYGASPSAPQALEINEVAPNFTLPRAGGGTVSLEETLATGPAAIIFYRGHW